ncbi:ATP-binding protein [Streptomyces lincolnensis]|uniref:ATP-binding protein n=1 Tax=Streptomyces lincolnensis TaxID=1915 RepID=A0A1B1MHA1_STRLN|nr:FxSxx-COOH system tetratricopeptide repeat protein [Streptomyces lincolnensis]ANS67907.1 ATP-binding protein [Streptomyces lincolnensis]AXG53888.1 ATP-binding protein [Streptomyces lincolnensis]QMV09560.1 tetratricopeptide repeat protein [Streptomyces lincolnensis]
MVNLDEHPLLIEPVVAWPRVAETECDYLVTVDLRGPLPEGSDPERVWPYPEEEFTFTVALDGSPYFVCTVLDEPSVVLHRFGGTYGPAHFKVSTGRATGHGALWLTVSNQWGVPVRKAELRSEVREREPGQAPAARLAEVMRQRASSVRPSERTGDIPWSQEPTTGTRVTDIRSTTTPGVDKPSSPTQRRPRLGRQTITISFTPFDQDWADWIGHRLEQRGHRVVLQRWDPPPGASLEESLRDLLLAPGPVLLLLSDQYLLSGAHTEGEWDAALREVLIPEAERVAVVMVAPSQQSTYGLDISSLYDVSADEAERRLLGRLALSAEPEPRATTGAVDEPPFPVHTLRVWGRIPERNERFTGRVALLNTAYERLQRESRVTLCGLSGVGKTQLAAEYAYRFAYGYHVVWWINAGSRAAFRQGLADLAPALGLSTGTGHGERFRAVREALRRGEPYERWLLILDGADDPDQVRDLVPNGPGHVLITSCNQDWGDHNSALVQVAAYDRAESVDFIRRRAPRLTDDDACQLAEALADLPLVLDQTAGWLDESGMSVAEYLELLARDSVTDDLVVSSDFPMTFRAAWAVLLERLRAGCPDSVLLLRLCTFFAPDAVPLRLLRETPVDGLPPAVAQLLTDPGRWSEAVQQLRTYSVVRIENPAQGSSGDVLAMHRMVHQTVRDDMSEEEKWELADVAWRALVAADPGNPNEAGTWSRYAELVPHLEYTDVLFRDAEAAQQLVFNCLRYLYVSGEYETGIRLAEQTMSVWQQLRDGNADLLWDLGHHYANLLRVVGDYRNSEAVSRAAVEQFRSVGGVGDSRYLRAASGLAADLRALGRFEEALDLSREVHESYRVLRGELHEDTLAAVNNVAVSLRLLGRYGEAAEINQRVFQARERVLGADHFWTLLSEVHWATDLRLMGRYEEAQHRQRANVGKYREALGDNHPYSFQALYNLAQCEYRTGDTVSAGERFATVLARCERLLGKDDPLTLMFAVARCCYAREHGDVDHARRLSEAVVDRYERRLGSAHPYSAGARANHALILRTVGEHRQARALGERALADMTQAVGAAHPWTLGCAVNVVASSPDRAVVAELGRETVARATECLGGDHRLTRVARAALDEDNGRRIYWDFEPQTT